MWLLVSLVICIILILAKDLETLLVVKWFRSMCTRWSNGTLFGQFLTNQLNGGRRLDMSGQTCGQFSTNLIPTVNSCRVVRCVTTFTRGTRALPSVRPPHRHRRLVSIGGNSNRFSLGDVIHDAPRGDTKIITPRCRSVDQWKSHVILFRKAAPGEM